MSLLRTNNTQSRPIKTGERNNRRLERTQKKRLRELVAFAVQHSPFYSRYYSHRLPANIELTGLPPVTKKILMANFDEWATNPAVSRVEVEAFVADPRLVGQLYRDHYAVYTTSGTTGTPGLFLHDQQALAVYDRLWQHRGWRKWMGLWRLFYVLRPDFREVFVVATGGHFGGAATAARLRLRYPWLGDRLQILSVLSPLPELVQQLNQLQPSVLAIYPTALALLAREQTEGRLQIRPQLIVTSGEWLSPGTRIEAAGVFHCSVYDVYASSEFMYMAFGCTRGWLHANADWLILEPVDAGYQSIPPGQHAHTVLLTNLANNIQPLIRYDLGDSVTFKSTPCPCGNPLPALRVEGRQEETITFPAKAGTAVQVLPMALATVVETTPGVLRYQIIQVAPATLKMRLEVTPGAESTHVWESVEKRLQEFLTNQSVSDVTLQKTLEPPRRDPRSGKFRQIWSEIPQRSSV